MKRRMVIGFLIGAVVGFSPYPLVESGVPAELLLFTIFLPGACVWNAIADDLLGPALSQAFAFNIVFYALLGLLGGCLRTKRRRISPETADACVSCGYCLTGNVSGICPECGTRIGLSAPRKDTRPLWLVLIVLLLVWFVGVGVLIAALQMHGPWGGLWWARAGVRTAGVGLGGLGPSVAA